MARQPIKDSPIDKDPEPDAPAVQSKEGTVQQVSNAPLDPMPEQPGTMTEAAANALKPTVEKGPSKGAAEQLDKVEAGEEVPRPEFYRVLVDKAVNMSGNRSIMRAGKELDSSQYNIRHLRQQGVKMEQINPETGEAITPQ